jgi:hypothetical protein
MRIFEHLPIESASFTHECFPENFIDGDVVTDHSPDLVLAPIHDAFAASGRHTVGVALSPAVTGALWDAGGPCRSPQRTRC